MIWNNCSQVTFASQVKRKYDFVSSAEPYLHKRVLWKSAGAETDQQQDSPLLVRPLKSNLHFIKSNFWQLDCAVHCLQCTALAPISTRRLLPDVLYLLCRLRLTLFKIVLPVAAGKAGAPPSDPPRGRRCSALDMNTRGRCRNTCKASSASLFID